MPVRESADLPVRYTGGSVAPLKRSGRSAIGADSLGATPMSPRSPKPEKRGLTVARTKIGELMMRLDLAEHLIETRGLANERKRTRR